MQNLSLLLKRAGRVVSDNSPALLTTIAVTGTVATAVVAVRATPAAIERLNLAKYDMMSDEDVADGYSLPLTRWDYVRLTWDLYIPAAGVGIATIIAIVGSNGVSTRRNASLLAAVSLTEKAFVEYKDKVVEQLGKGKDQKVRAAIAQDHVNANPVSGSQVFITGNGDVLMHDDYSGRYFNSSIESVRKIQNDLNAILMHEGNVGLNEFYEAVGLSRLRHGDDLGWNLSNMLQVEFHGVISEDGKPCIAVDFQRQPTAQYWKYS